ncbi:putative dehydrogenase [Amycolatopsis bartoniae]|uniref:Uncharacterized protein n=1 Tax=Amycolatopsis bartoniae TaxID=941986 RepID=A0A8H9IY63_9PSEU|nr:hypothetical protein [Amycolatopsis bartoniae]MBB2935514.1 putative dehydrogenase [Amycolatopsis bartoniae]GHF76471.1 hypothetical protein GCM10017566_58180 [Amycolatopsis bartoniae]
MRRDVAPHFRENVAALYRAFAAGEPVPGFADEVRLHRLLDAATAQL